MNLCINCIFFRDREEFGKVCVSTQVAGDYIISPVDGKRSQKIVYCFDARSNIGACGKEGKLFSPSNN